MHPAFACLVSLAHLAEGGATSSAGEGWGGLLAWIGLAALLALGAGIALVWRLVEAVGRVEARLEALGRELEQLGGHAARLAAQPEGLDLRRLEHVLIDLRDAQARLHEALLTGAEEARRAAAPSPPAPTGRPLEPAERIALLLERVHDRLHSLGYERIEVVGERERLAELLEGRGEIWVEARRGAVLHKGRLEVDSGRIVDVDIRPPYAMFP